MKCLLEQPSSYTCEGKEDTKVEAKEDVEAVSAETTELASEEVLTERSEDDAVISEGSGEDVEVASEEVTEKRSQGTINRGSVIDVDAKSEDEFEVDCVYSVMNKRSVVVIQ